MKKKQSLSSTFVWLKDVGLKVFAILALVVGGFYASAAIIWPADQPNGTTGVVGMFIGESTADFNAAVVGYAQANALCANGAGNIAKSHVCTPDEMINSINHGVLNISPIYTYVASPTLWINNGPPAYTASANDCKGWTVTTAGPDYDQNFGAAWFFGNKFAGLTLCSTGRKFACCK